MQVKYRRYGTYAAFRLSRPRGHAIWKLRSNADVPDAAVKLTDNREIAPYPWHHADDER